MAMIQVARDGAKIGEFTLEQVQAGLASGQFRATDLGWQSGMAEWRPLSEFVPAAAGSTPPQVPLAVAGGASAAAGRGLPWENRAQIGFGKAWFDTVAALITKPSEAFTMMRPEGGLADPLLFGLIGGCAGSFVSFVFQILFRSVAGLGGGADFYNPFGFDFGPGIMIAVYAALTPVMVIFGLFVGSAVLHLCLMMVGGANRSFETTFRVACFTTGSANLFSMIPFCGGLIALVYNIVLECIGLTRAHPTTTGKALMAIFLPLIACCGLILLFVILIGGFGAAAAFLSGRS